MTSSLPRQRQARRAGRAARWLLPMVAWLAAAMVAPRGARAAGSTVHVARAGDTPESLAALYYGKREQAIFIREANHLGASGRLKEGQAVRIPGAFRIKVKKGESLERLAQKFLEDPKRARFLGEWNGLKLDDVLHEGAELKVPFHLLHRAEAPEALNMLAKAFYNDPTQGKLLADYNGRKVMVLTKGERLVIPVPHVFVKAAMLSGAKAVPPTGTGTPVAGAGGTATVPAPGVAAVAPVEPAAAEGAAGKAALSSEKAMERVPDKSAERAPEKVAERAPERLEDPKARRAAERLRAAEDAWHEGRYEDVVDDLTRVIADDNPPEPQRAAMQRLLGFAYVAIGHEEPAVAAFRELLRHEPEATLDVVTVSPKIRSVFERARAGR